MRSKDRVKEWKGREIGGGRPGEKATEVKPKCEGRKQGREGTKKRMRKREKNKEKWR